MKKMKLILLCVVCFASIPIGFRIALYLNQWMRNLSELTLKLEYVFMMYIAIGILCGIFIVFIRCIVKQMQNIYKYGGLMAILLLVCNLFLSWITLANANLSTMNVIEIFSYFNYPRYIVFITIIVIVVIADIIKFAKRKEVR